MAQGSGLRIRILGLRSLQLLWGVGLGCEDSVLEFGVNGLGVEGFGTMRYSRAGLTVVENCWASILPKGPCSYMVYNRFPLIINDVPPPNNTYSGEVKNCLVLGGNIY